jgi:hypothetical protein
MRSESMHPLCRSTMTFTQIAIILPDHNFAKCIAYKALVKPKWENLYQQFQYEYKLGKLCLDFWRGKLSISIFDYYY